MDASIQNPWDQDWMRVAMVGWLVGLQSTEQKAFIRWLIKLTPRLIWKTSVLFMSSFSIIENSEQCKNIVIKIAICTHIFVCGGMLRPKRNMKGVT